MGIAIKNKFFLFLFMLFFVSGCVAGCAWHDMTPREKYISVGTTMSEKYLELHEQYVQLEQKLPESWKQKMMQKAAKTMDQAKKALIAYNETVLAGLGGEPESLRKKNELWERLGELSQVLTEIALDYATKSSAEADKSE